MLTDGCVFCCRLSLSAITVRWGDPIPLQPPPFKAKQKRKRGRVDKQAIVKARLGPLFDRVGGTMSCPYHGGKGWVQGFGSRFMLSACMCVCLPLALSLQNQGGKDIWQRKVLDHLFSDAKNCFLEQLRTIAFNMANGPWQRTWVSEESGPQLTTKTSCDLV